MQRIENFAGRMLPVGLATLVFLALFLMVSIPSSQGKGNSDHKAELDFLRNRAEELEKQDGEKAANRETDLLKSWLMQGQASLTAGDTRELDRLLRRARYQIQYIETLIDASRAEAKARAHEEELEQMERSLERHRSDIERLQQERESLIAQEAESGATPGRDLSATPPSPSPTSTPTRDSSGTGGSIEGEGH